MLGVLFGVNPFVEVAFIERAKDGDTDADHCGCDFGGGPDDDADCVICDV